MKRLFGLEREDVELEIGECDCGYHFGVDATYLEQVKDFKFRCPACGRVIDTRILFVEDC